MIGPAFPDWRVTVIFYAALHAFDSLLTHDNVRVVSHTERNGILTRTNRYSQIRKHYLPLYDLSQKVRYLARPEQWVPPDQIMPCIIQGMLYPIETSVQKLMNLQLELPTIDFIA